MVERLVKDKGIAEEKLRNGRTLKYDLIPDTYERLVNDIYLSMVGEHPWSVPVSITPVLMATALLLSQLKCKID